MAHLSVHEYDKQKNKSDDYGGIGRDTSGMEAFDHPLVIVCRWCARSFTYKTCIYISLVTPSANHRPHNPHTTNHTPQNGGDDKDEDEDVGEGYNG